MQTRGSYSDGGPGICEVQSQLPAVATQAQNKHRTAIIPQSQVRNFRFIFLSLLEEDYRSWYSAPKNSDFVTSNIYLSDFPLDWLHFHRYFALSRQNLQQLQVSRFLVDLTLVCFWPHHIKSPSLAFDPLINNSSPVLRAVTSWKELDTRLWGIRMLGLPTEFGTGQFLSCQNQYLDKMERGSVKNG